MITLGLWFAMAFLISAGDEKVARGHNWLAFFFYCIAYAIFDAATGGKL